MAAVNDGSPLLEQMPETLTLSSGPSPVRSNSRSDENQLWKLNYQEAAIYLEEGKNNERFTTHPKNQDAVPSYLIVHNVWFNLLDLLVSLLLLFLALCERPAVHLLKLDEVVHSSLELFALTIIALQLGMKMRWLGFKTFVTHKRTAIKSATLLVMYAEAIVVLVRQTSHFRVTRALRPIFLIDTQYCGGVRRVMRQILQSLPPIVDMLVLLLFFMLIFAVLAFYLFIPDQQNYLFERFEDCFVHLFILLTTANFPDVMMPAYNTHRSASLFFIVYLVIELYFLMNLLLAVVYETFTGIEKEKFRQLLLHKYKGATCAFKLLCSKQNPGKIPFTHFEGLMKYYKPRHKQKDVYLTFKALNTHETELLSLQEFTKIYEMSELKWKVKTDNAHWFDRLPRVPYVLLKCTHKMVTSKLFEYFIYVAIGANGIWFLVDTVKFSNNDSNRGEPIVFEVTWYSIMFVAIYTVEAILKILALGPTTYFNSGWNVFDFCVTLSSIGGIFGELLHASFYYIVVLRPLRLLRLFKIKKRYRDVMDTLFVLLPRMVSVAIVLLIMYYFFAIIGMECFSEIQLKNCCKNTSVEAFYSYRNTTPETQYLNKYFYLNNFENILASYVTLFELTIINNWHITMEAVYIVTSRWSRIYFMLFYISSMVVITIAIAFILEAFLFRMQYQITVIKSREQKDTLEERMVEVDIPLTKNELENNFPRYLADLDLASLHQQLSQVESLTFRGLRGTTKADLSCIMYRDEVKTWIAEEEAKGKADLRHFLHRLTSQQSVQQIETEEGEEEEAETNSTHQTAVVV